MTFEEFCAANEIKVSECAYSGMEETKHDWGKSRVHQYLLVLQRGSGGTLGTKWAAGEGIVERWAKETDTRSNVPVPIGGGERVFRASQLPGRWDTLAGQMFLKFVAPQYRPEAAGVLYCLASDAGGVQNSRGFEDWAADLGYDADSRKAEAIYRACCDMALALQRWLGLEKYAQLLACTEE